jgi:hypothetical protein
MTIYEYRQIVVPASILLPIMIAVSGYRKLPDYAKWLLYYLVLAAIVNTTATITTWNKVPNLWLLHIYTTLESFLLLYYFKLIIINKKIRSVVGILLWAFPLFCIINFLFLQSINNFNTYTRPIEAIILITLCAVYWWQENETDSEKSWGDIPNNWFVTGIMLYFAGAFIMFLLANYLITQQAIRKAKNIIMDTHASFVLIMYLLMAVGFLKCRK